MKVIFVGMHNKPGKEPLCSSTKSGRLVDRIIDALKPVECGKTNLYDVDSFPDREEKLRLSRDWHTRIRPERNDIIVLLGAEVQEHFVSRSFDRIVQIAHPSSQRSHQAMNEYVGSAVEKIKDCCS